MSNRTPQLHAVNAVHVMTTNNMLPTELRHVSIETLNGVLAQAIDLALAAKHAHWNMRGRQFLSSHQMFDRVFVDLIEQINAIGERTVTLGGIVRGTVHAVAESSQFDPYPVLTLSEPEHTEQLALRLGRLGERLRHAIITATQKEDVVTAHILADAAAVIDRLLWMIESHIEYA